MANLAQQITDAVDTVMASGSDVAKMTLRNLTAQYMALGARVLGSKALKQHRAKLLSMFPRPGKRTTLDEAEKLSKRHALVAVRLSEAQTVLTEYDGDNEILNAWSDGDFTAFKVGELLRDIRASSPSDAFAAACRRAINAGVKVDVILLNVQRENSNLDVGAYLATLGVKIEA